MSEPYTMGNLGGEIVTGNKDGLDPNWRAIQVIAEATVDAITINGVSDPDDGLVGTWPVGTYLFGQGVTAYSQTAGTVYLIK